MEMEGIKVYSGGEENAKKSPREREKSSQEALNKFYKTFGKVAAFAGAAALYSREMDTQMFVPEAIGGAGMLAVGTDVLYHNSALVRSFYKAIDAEMAMDRAEKAKHLSASKEELNKSHIVKFAKKLKTFRDAVKPQKNVNLAKRIFDNKANGRG